MSNGWIVDSNENEYICTSPNKNIFKVKLNDKIDNKDDELKYVKDKFLGKDLNDEDDYDEIEKYVVRSFEDKDREEDIEIIELNNTNYALFSKYNNEDESLKISKIGTLKSINNEDTNYIKDYYTNYYSEHKGSLVDNIFESSSIIYKQVNYNFSKPGEPPMIYWIKYNENEYIVNIETDEILIINYSS